MLPSAVQSIFQEAVVSLMPTPAVNDMGEGKTLEWWEEWASRQKAADGRPAPHGKSLHIEVLKLLNTPNTMDMLEPRSGEALERQLYRGGSSSKRERSSNLREEIMGITSWGEYAPAISRWEYITGSTAPAPKDPSGRDGGMRLAPRFTEWLMGLPAGWTTDPAIWAPLNWSAPKTRSALLKMHGNGVVPQQAFAALLHLLAWRDQYAKTA